MWSKLLTLTLLAGTVHATTHEDNLAILKSIPLVPGLEKKASDEDEIAKKLHTIFSKIADESKNKDGSINRGTHASGSCFNGELTVLSSQELAQKFHYDNQTITRIKRGVFKNESVYSAEIRFANGKGQRNPDTTNDVRAISFAVDTGNSRLDFMMNSTPMFATNNIQEFYELMKAARLAMGEFHLLNPFYLKSTLKAKKLLDFYERNDSKSYATENYWSNLPYVHGPEIVKYKVTPCDGKGRQSEKSEGKASNYLQKDIREKVMNDKVCFYLQVQLMDYNKLKTSLDGIHKDWSVSDWIENGGELWDENVLPFKTIAKITLPSYLNKEKSDCSVKYINTRLHSSSQHRPIGSIARVRTYVEEKSRAKRMGEIR